MSTVVDKDTGRKADLAQIHMAKKDLGWDDGMYRDVLFSVCRVKSSGELDFTGRKRFIAHLQACGWKGGSKKPGGNKPASAARAPLTKPQRLIWSLWQQLADAGLVTDRKMPALNSYCERQAGVTQMVWLKAEQQALVIESLKAWLARAPKKAGA